MHTQLVKLHACSIIYITAVYSPNKSTITKAIIHNIFFLKGRPLSIYLQTPIQSTLLYAPALVYDHKNQNDKNANNNTTPAYASATRYPSTHIAPRGRDRCRSSRPCYGPRSPPRGPQRRGIRARRPGWRHLGLHP